MNRFISKVLLITITIIPISTINTLASKKPPIPKGSGGFDGGVVVGGTIDEYVLSAMIISALFAVWIINSNRKQFTNPS